MDSSKSIDVYGGILEFPFTFHCNGSHAQRATDRVPAYPFAVARLAAGTKPPGRIGAPQGAPRPETRLTAVDHLAH